ncbi:hypothetical protein Pla8534_66510 [Lignipirellula cremea]|uniref:Uncharacterized protein n=1 Tax=Lignipirellula cremea TaxID=2528010 RepID=A0A518E3W1_9BACT|nr:hypothetical protein Pla8534_66510 [Lignipirellula cremea]
MVQHRHHNNDQPGYHSDPAFRHAIHRYLCWFALACLIASIHAGPVTVLVWIAVAYVLTREGGSQGRKPPQGKCNQPKRRGC